MTALSLHDLTVELGRRPALNGVTTRIEKGGFTAICGPNGAGKTTLLRAAQGLVKPIAGQVLIDGVEVRRMTEQERAARVGYLAQDRRIAWGMPALDIAALGAIAAGPAEAEARARAALAEVGLADLEGRGTFEMSGGERARVLLARLFATGAPLLLLDEPVAGLDPDAQLLVLDLLKARAADGATIVATLHDLSLAARYAERVIVLKDGRVVADGAPQDALSTAILRTVFGLAASWVATQHGPVLVARRLP